MCKLLVSTNFNCTAEITFFYKLLNTTSALCVQIKSFRNKDNIKYTRKRPDKIKCRVLFTATEIGLMFLADNLHNHMIQDGLNTPRPFKEIVELGL